MDRIALLVGPTILPGYMRHAERTEPQELLATMAGHFALTGQIVATPVIWATAQVHALLLVTRNTKDFPVGDPGVRSPYKV